MRRLHALVLTLALAASSFAPSGAGASDVKPPRKASPPGQVLVATVNAKQNKILGQKRFKALLELARAFRFRPPAFNGGFRGAVMAPDVVVITEFRETNVEILDRLLREKFDQPYEIVGPSDLQAALIVNTATVTLEGEVDILEDVCLNDETTGKKRLSRDYPVARFTEDSTGSTFTIAGVHFAGDYSASGQSNCLPRNVIAIKDRLEDEPGTTFVAGDFNFRATEVPYECDPDERSGPARWWSLLVTPEGGRAYVDAARLFHRARGLPMTDEWTFQHSSGTQTCAGTIGVRRARIDYIFASGATVAESHVDHPGWTADGNYKYSDHRYVLGRFVLTGPPRPNRPELTPDQGGVIRLAWEPVEGVSTWVVYRARQGRQYAELARIPGDSLAYDDGATEHDRTYRYSIAPVGAKGGQGVEAGGVWGTADARGPRVAAVFPAPGATRVDRDVTIKVIFDEWVAESSVGDRTISLYRNRRRVAGRVVRQGGFVLKFNPAFRLRPGESYTILVRPVADVLGNAGPRFTSRFTVKPKRRRHKG